MGLETLFLPVCAESLAVFRVMWAYFILERPSTLLTSTLMQVVQDAILREETADWVLQQPLHLYPERSLQLLNEAFVRLYMAYPTYGFLVAYYLPQVQTWAAWCFLVGFMPRLSALVVYLTYTIPWILHGTDRFVNHFYMKSLVWLLLVMVNTGAAYSVQRLLVGAWRLLRRPADQRGTVWEELSGSNAKVSRAGVLMIRFLVCVIYFYGALTKVNPDWLRAEPWTYYMTSAYRMRQITVWTLDLFAGGGREAIALTARFISIMGIVYDFGIIWLLLYLVQWPFSIEKRQSWLVFALMLATSTYFHVMNSFTTLHIGQFPPMMATLTMLFLPYDWPSRALGFVAECMRGLALLDAEDAPAALPRPRRKRSGGLSFRQKVLLVLMLAFVVWQVGYPARKVMSTHRGIWSNENMYFAWQMMMTHFEGQSTAFIVAHPETNETLAEVPYKRLHVGDTVRQEKYSTGRDVYAIGEARRLADLVEERNGVRPKVYSKEVVKLNERPWQPRFVPGADLADPDATLLQLLEEEHPLPEEYRAQVWPRFYCYFFFC